MEVPDKMFTVNRDWDPSYLHELMSGDFFEFSELWTSNVGDNELVKETNRVERERYCPVVEDISIEDDVLCSAVEKIEEE